MRKSIYADHINEIITMRYGDDKKKWSEIVKYLNVNFDIKAKENTLIVFTRRYVEKNKWDSFNLFLMTATDEDFDRADRGDFPPGCVLGEPCDE